MPGSRWPRVSLPSAFGGVSFGAPLCALVLLSACAKKAPLPAGVELETLPALPLKLDFEFGGAVELLGAKVSPTSALKPGSRVEVTLFWRRKGVLPRGFGLFTHLLDGAGERLLNLDATGPLRKTEAGKPLHPPSTWPEGKVMVDQLSFWVPASVRTDDIRLVCGLFSEDERLPLTRGGGPGERAERAEVMRLSVQRPLSPSAGGIPTLWVPRRVPTAPLVIDGKLDEPSWSRAATTGGFVNVATGEAASTSELGGSAKLMYDDQALYVGFEVFDDDLRGGFDPNEADPHLWLKDTVEIMIDPDGDGDNRDYYEIQVGPQNLVFDSAFDGYNQPRVEPNGPFGHQEWSAKLTSAVMLQGTLDDARADDGYVVELAIPWASFAKAKRAPPQPNDIWRMNFYAMQNNGGVSWSPILGQGNFHKASRFGRVRFVGPTKPGRH